MYIKEFGFIGLKFTVQGLRFRAQGSGAKFKCLKYIKVPKMPKVKDSLRSVIYKFPGFPNF